MCAGVGVESKDKGSSCLLGCGMSSAIPVRDPWELRARRIVEISEASQNFILFGGGVGLGGHYGRSASRRGKGKWSFQRC